MIKQLKGFVQKMDYIIQYVDLESRQESMGENGKKAMAIF